MSDTVRRSTEAYAGPAGAPGRPLRVLYLNTPRQPPLGADTWIHARILEGLDRSTHELHAACSRGPADDPTPAWREISAVPDVRLRPVDLGPEVSSNRTRRDRIGAVLSSVAAARSLVSLAWYVHRRRIDVLHTSDRPRDAAAVVLLGRLTRTPTIVHVHVAWGEWMSGMLKRALRGADALVGVSSSVRDSLVEAGHDPTRCHVVLNAIQPERWHPGQGREDARRELGIPDGDPVIVTVCRLFPGKGPGELIRALAKVRADHPAARLVIVGREMVDGYVAELRALAAELGVADRVIFTGLRRDVDRMMAAADVYAMPSLGEPFGLVFAEAMAMELPVVALDSGGAPEVVEHGRTGLLSAYGDVDELARNLSALLGDPERRRTMGRLGRARVEEHFTVERMARDMAAVYRVVAAGPTAQGGQPR